MARGILVGALVAAFAVIAAAQEPGQGDVASDVDGSSSWSDPGGLEPLQNGACGDGQCQPPEDCHTCRQDCGDCCGNTRCEPPEDCRSCPQDCGQCT
jgi:hypothetical protein